MNSTDIPNGFVVRGPKTPILLDYDDGGRAIDIGYEVVVKHPAITDSKGNIKDSLFVLVHTVKGDGGMLMKLLDVSEVRAEGKAVPVKELARSGLMKDFAEEVRRKYLEKKLKEDKDAQSVPEEKPEARAD